MAQDHKQHPVVIDPYELRKSLPREENLEELADNLPHYKDKLVLFLGAGASMGAVGGVDSQHLPSALTLRNEIWSKFMLKRDPEGNQEELGMMSLDQAAAFAESKIGREMISRFIENRFTTKCCLWQHFVLKHLNPIALYTTNYDLLIEQGWNSNGYRNDKNLVPIFSEGQKVSGNSVALYKPHGSADRALDKVGSGGPVVTTIDYFEMLTTKRVLLDQWLDNAKNGCVIMIGYSMADMDVGGVMYQLRKTHNTINWYSVFPRDDSSVRKYWSERLRIRPISRRFVEFMVELDDLVDFIPQEIKYCNIKNLQARNYIQ